MVNIYPDDVSFIEDDLTGMAEAAKSGQEGKSRDNGQCDLMMPFGSRRIDIHDTVWSASTRGGGDSHLHLGRSNVGLIHAILQSKSSRNDW